MRVLLPPSETKRSGGGSISFFRENLAHAETLGETRERVLHALEALCVGTDAPSEDAAAKVLKLGVKARGEIAHNRALTSSAAMPAIERYTGVLYDALDAASLDGPARRWLDEHVSIQSSLFGLIHAGDLIPAYRLSASSPLPVPARTAVDPDSAQAPQSGQKLAARKPASLKAQWREAHSGIAWENAPLIIDLRSKDYAALAPIPSSATAVVVEVASRSDDGQTRALNHFNKQAKGDLVRRLALSGAVLTSVGELIAWADDHGLEIIADPETPGHVTLVTELGAPGGS